MKILYYLAGIGYPNYDTKKDILFHNLKLLSSQGNVDIILNIYDEKIVNDIQDSLKLCGYVNNIYSHYYKGILCQMWLTNPYNHITRNYDCVVLCLDDVEIIDIDIDDILVKKKILNIDLLSPCIQGAFHPWLMEKKEGVDMYITRAIEFYVFIMDSENFHKYLNIQKADNPWGWGQDMLLGYLGFNCGIYHRWNARHVYKQTNGESAVRQAENQMVVYLNRLGFDSYQEVRFMEEKITSSLTLNW